MDHDEVRKFLTQNECDYVLNPPLASHAGGVWERQIRSMCNIMSSLLMDLGQQLDDEMLCTLMCESATIVNCLPLSTESVNHPTAVLLPSPHNLLTMKSCIVLPPPGKFERMDVYCRRRWRRVQYLVNEFCHCWKRVSPYASAKEQMGKTKEELEDRGHCHHQG